jgi:hypothetical protein
MNIKCTITIDYTNKKTADHVLKSIQLDDQTFVTSTVANTTLTATIESTSVSSLFHTLDDYLACVSLASNVVNKH